MKYSLVVPLYNEEGNVLELHKQIVTAMEKLKEKYEIIFINDGSDDKTYEKAKKLSPLRLITLQRKSGQTAAMDAGIKAANGKFIITMDGDLQNDPKDIPKLITQMRKGNYDVVSGWRKDRKDPFMKKFISRGAHVLRQILIKDGIHDSGCSLKIYKRECFETLDLYGEMHRFIPALLKMRGYEIGEIPVAHHARKHGVTKYTWKRTVKGFLDMLSVVFWGNFAARPLHFLGGIGFGLFLIGFLSGLWAICKKLFFETDLSDTSFTVLAMFCFFFGFLFILLGLLFDAVSKVYYSGTRDKSYIVKEEKKL